MNRRFRSFIDPPWAAPLDVNAVLRSIPESATIVGMFIEPLAESARKAGNPLPSARDKYTHYKFYPLKEHAQLLVETCARIYPRLSLRQALRKLGRAAPKALMDSTIGKVTFGAASGIEGSLRAWVRTYPLHLRPGFAHVVEVSASHAILRLEEIHYFLDCHHVGSLEGVFTFLDKRATVRINAHSATSADLLCSW